MLGSIVKFTAAALTGAVATVIAMHWSDTGALEQIRKDIIDKKAMLEGDETLNANGREKAFLEWISTMRPEWKKRFLLQINAADLDTLLKEFI